MFQNLSKEITFPLNIKALVHLASRMKVTECHALNQKPKNQTNDQLKVNCWIKLSTLLQGSCRISAKKGDTVVQKSSLASTACTHHLTAMLPKATCQKKQPPSPVSWSSHLANTVISPLQCTCCLSAVPALFTVKKVCSDRETDTWQLPGSGNSKGIF